MAKKENQYQNEVLSSEKDAITTYNGILDGSIPDKEVVSKLYVKFDTSKMPYHSVKS